MIWKASSKVDGPSSVLNVVGLHDPPRDGVASLSGGFPAAGINSVTVTIHILSGDNYMTCIAFAKQIG